MSMCLYIIDESTLGLGQGDTVIDMIDLLLVFEETSTLISIAAAAFWISGNSTLVFPIPTY